MKCVICGRRPANGSGYCAPCLDKMNSQRKVKAEPQHFLTYRGHVVGLYPDGAGRLTARPLQRNPNRLPKGKTINLNVYCEGYTREVIKRFQSCVLQLAYA